MSQKQSHKPLNSVVHDLIEQCLRNGLELCKRVDPEKASDEDFAAVIELLITARVTRSAIAKRLKLAPNTISRHLEVSPSKDSNRPWYFLQARDMLEQSIQQKTWLTAKCG